MYAEAISKGYDVTPEEIDEYISDLKQQVKDAENKSDIEKVINEFDSEEAYWKYQKIIAKKSLPITKYIKALEEDYRKNHANEDPELQNEGWDKEFKYIKEAAVKRQDFKAVNSPDCKINRFNIDIS